MSILLFASKTMAQDSAQKGELAKQSFEKQAKNIASNIENITKEEKAELKASALIAHVQELGLAFKTLKISIKEDDTVVVAGEVEEQADSEKITLALGNVEGVESVDNQMTVATPSPEARYHMSGSYSKTLSSRDCRITERSFKGFPCPSVANEMIFTCFILFLFLRICWYIA